MKITSTLEQLSRARVLRGNRGKLPRKHKRGAPLLRGRLSHPGPQAHCKTPLENQVHIMIHLSSLEDLSLRGPRGSTHGKGQTDSLHKQLKFKEKKLKCNTAHHEWTLMAQKLCSLPQSSRDLQMLKQVLHLDVESQVYQPVRMVANLLENKYPNCNTKATYLSQSSNSAIKPECSAAEVMLGRLGLLQ